MRGILPICIFFLGFVNVSGQKADFKVPDYKGIERIIKDNQSEFYYPTLMDRYQNSDTTLSLSDYRVLYYGFLYSDLYSPYGQSDYVDTINVIFSKDTLCASDYNDIIKFENLVLESFPFNLRDLNSLSYCYFQKGDSSSMKATNYKIKMIISTILSTGDGKKENSAWHVIAVGHEYDLLYFLGFQFGGSQSLTKKGCDYLKVNENEYGIEGFYFDVNKILEKEENLFKN